MKQAGYSKRPQGRSSERHRPHNRKTNRDSGDTKVRGNAQQCVEKYLTLARDAASLGDPISAENYYQYADHYYRMSVASRPVRGNRPEKPSERRPISTPPATEAPEAPSPDID